MDVASPCNSRGVRKPAWLGLVMLAIHSGCTAFMGSDVLESIRENRPIHKLAQATGERMQSLRETIHDSLPVYIGTTPASFLRHVRSNPDPNIRFLAYGKLGDPELYDSPAIKTEAVSTLVAKLQEGKEPLAIRAIIVRSLGQLGDPRARDVIAHAVGDPEGVVRTEACRALGRVGHADDATTLIRIMTVDPLEDCRIAAIDGVGDLKSRDPRVLHVLIDGMDHEDPAIRFGCYRALKKITGKDPGNTTDAWRRELEPQTTSSPATPKSSDSPAKEPVKRPTPR
jgi:HEAT repeats